MIKEVLVVEGRSDVARIRASHIDVDMITTDGFNLKPHTRHYYPDRPRPGGGTDPKVPDRSFPQCQARLYSPERCYCQR